MAAFIHKDFLLENDAASKLYHEFAASLPIIDFHCHLPPEEIAENKQWSNLSQVWLDGDHYKWRAMRSNGIDEHFITGAASDREKFNAFAATMPYLLRNPLYHWSHLELARYFGIDDLLLSPETADEVWDRTSEVLQQGLSVRQLMQQSRVEVVCTTDDPADPLEHHHRMAEDPTITTSVLPTWRPDQCFDLESAETFNAYINPLASSAGCTISDYDDLISALRCRHKVFHQMGCRLSDHGLDVFTFTDTSESQARSIFSRIRNGEPIEAPDRCRFRSAMLLEFARMDAEKGWTKQLHIGALRFNNSRMGKTLGFDSIDDRGYAAPLSRYLDTLDREQKLPKTILYNLNPRDNEMMATMIGNFQDGSTAGKIQLGSGWWFMDQKDGMERQMEALSQMGLLRRFVGMVTDSRSFLSYTRHEYFRRVLCNLLGKDIQKGLLPPDFDFIGAMIQDICYNNANAYFGFNHHEQ
ncbi:glucuronate isomerase [Verrucomicrobiaceae bacterium N1E253]|uniref:Uronate isomerase n=1 Tax=Oceaniferula marina TaxID=2748318 RepID=A0A851GGF6_9BACT|nr:glucuronate isomerase [Oceaniferula marina]NWK56446.1 glucuronate isomerase [Oceaniferula marina]